MGIIDDLISTLKTDVKVREIIQGLFYTAVLTRHCGLAATLPKDSLRQEPPLVAMPGYLLNKSPIALAQMAYSDRIPEAAIGIATINSLIAVDEKRCQEINAVKLIAEKGVGKSVVIVGHFPFVSNLKNIISDLRIIERNPCEGDYSEDVSESLIPQAEVLAITGTAITNHSMESLLKMCNPGAYIIILGGTTPLSTVLFDYGANAICGTRVIDHELTIRCISQGATYRQIKGIKQLVMT